MVDVSLWDGFGWLYRVVLCLVSISFCHVVLLNSDAGVLHDMIDSIYPWRTPLIGPLPMLVINLCCAPVSGGRSWRLFFIVYFVVLRRHMAGR